MTGHRQGQGQGTHAHAAAAVAAARDAGAPAAASHREFNKTTKLFIRALIADLPNVSELAILHAAYKLTKTLSKALPSRLFAELLAEPYGERICSRDMAFFMSDAFKVPMWPAIVEAARRECSAMDAARMERLVWAPMVRLTEMSLALH